MLHQTLALLLTASIPLLRATSLPKEFDPLRQVADITKELDLTGTEESSYLELILKQSQMEQVAQDKELERLKKVKEREEAAQIKAFREHEKRAKAEREEQEKLLEQARKRTAEKRTKEEISKQSQLLQTFNIKTNDPAEVVSILEKQERELDRIESTKMSTPKKQGQALKRKEVITTSHKPVRSDPSLPKYVTQTVLVPAISKYSLQPKQTERVRLISIRPVTINYSPSSTLSSSASSSSSSCSSLSSSCSSSTSSSSSSSSPGSRTPIISKAEMSKMYTCAGQLGPFISPKFLSITPQQSQVRNNDMFMTLKGYEYEAFLSEKWGNDAFKHTNIYITNEHAIDEDFLEKLPPIARSLNYGQFLREYGMSYYDHIFKGMQQTQAAKTSPQKEQSLTS